VTNHDPVEESRIKLEETKVDLRRAVQQAIRTGDQHTQQAVYHHIGTEASEALNLAEAIDSALTHYDVDEQFPTKIDKRNARMQSLQFRELHQVARGLQALLAEHLDDELFTTSQ
jgi:hypothetical protein